MSLIRVKRIGLGMSQAELAKRAGMTASKLSKIENGFLRLKVEDVLIFARALDCHPSELIPEREEVCAVATRRD